MSQPPLLALEGVTKRFGGLTAVSDVSVAVAPGDLVGIIGPNGAGKTTLFNVISGYYRADRGRVIFAGQDVVGRPPHVICRMGLTRTFQLVKPFGNLSVVDNVMIGALTRLPTIRAARVEAERVIASCGLGSHATAHARTLPIGLRKRLEVARALATRPRLPLLDAVMAGLNPTELAGLIEKGARELAALVELLGAGTDDLLGEPPDALLQHLLLYTELDSHDFPFASRMACGSRGPGPPGS